MVPNAEPANENRQMANLDIWRNQQDMRNGVAENPLSIKESGLRKMT
ncbi:hypothetical protein BN1221_04123c [Brenneria goodwinii]|uniref:Uncharacterized protein n=1 Tax=Brenneria goodwinii TaxID=1109412 RepID=A0A0G4K0J3_9GAMM|nr:hypothetical protein BN1221_04123c [Brenneria goodwinii]